jgi:hypothetical protein
MKENGKLGDTKETLSFRVSPRAAPLRPYERLYMDGYGGQQSMGNVSSEGAIGGFVFARPTGSIKQKLYGTTEQLPAIL